MKFKSQLIKFPAHAHYIIITEEIGKAIHEQFGKRVICKVNDNASFHCAVQKNKHLGYFIMVGKNTQKKIQANTNDLLQIEILKDKTDYKAELPEELIEVLATDEEAFTLFEKLTDGKKRSIIHYISSAKQSETRIKRALKITENLMMGKTKGRELFK